VKTINPIERSFCEAGQRAAPFVAMSARSIVCHFRIDPQPFLRAFGRLRCTTITAGYYLALMYATRYPANSLTVARGAKGNANLGKWGRRRAVKRMKRAIREAK